MDASASNAVSAACDIANKLVKAVGRQLPSVQEEEGDDLLTKARDLVTNQVQSIVEGDDLKVIEDKIT